MAVFMSDGKTILFVYNADSGVLAGMKDYCTGGGTPPGRGCCNLSAITFSPVGMKKDWKRYVRELKIPSRFMDRNEFAAEFGQAITSFPAVLLRRGRELALLLSTDELNRCRELEDLTGLLDMRIAQVP
jgi:hypothetical protein